MIHFTHAISKTPAQSLINGLSLTENNEKPDYALALKQHQAYRDALAAAGLSVTCQVADEAFPDSCFVEDVAVVTPSCVIITRPGAKTRQDEIQTVPTWFTEHVTHVDKPLPQHTITADATLEGGDVMLIDKHFYVGLSSRTNAAGVEQFREIVSLYGYSVTAVPVTFSLHLKTGVTYLGAQRLLMVKAYEDCPEFADFEKIITPNAENNCANIIRINNHVVIPAGYPVTEKALKDLGYTLLTVDISEFAKIDGGLTCLSLRF